MSRIKLLMEVKEDADNLAYSLGTLINILNGDEEKMQVEESTEESEKNYSLEEVRRILAEKSRQGHTEKIRELLGKYGAKKLSEIDSSLYKELVSDVEEI